MPSGRGAQGWENSYRISTGRVALPRVGVMRYTREGEIRFQSWNGRADFSELVVPLFISFETKCVRAILGIAVFYLER